jgi:hypothetical protein
MGTQRHSSPLPGNDRKGGDMQTHSESKRSDKPHKPQKLGGDPEIHREKDDSIYLTTKIKGGYTDRWTDTDGYTDRQTAKLPSKSPFIFQNKEHILLKTKRKY